nr:MAG TPA: hypothetical protein [Caudoviricetes sp.]
MNCDKCVKTRNILGKLETKIFYFTSTKTRNSEIVLPRPSTRSGIPPPKTLST